jgi:predicted AAA+ superfamily ATPase
MERPLYLDLWAELARAKAMVFLAGPRQTGKTTLAKAIAEQFPASVYWNWDVRSDRAKLLKDFSFFTYVDRKDDRPPLIIFDEIHKYRRWKNYLKGTCDAFAKDYRFLVLGSGRLNVYQKGGDSLAGRYYLMSLWPLTLAELGGRRRSFAEFRRDLLAPVPEEGLQSLWEKLHSLSGFPEPYLSGSVETYRRWSNAYHQQLIREDIRDATDLKRLDDLEALSLLLPSRVGNPLSMESLARDIEVSFKSIRSWIEVFERFFICFRLQPWSERIARGLKKQSKLYLYDYPQIEPSAARFENMVALELRRAVSTWNEWGWGTFDLFFVRNKDGQEADFLLTERRKPLLLIEAKESDVEISDALMKFQSRLQVPALQLVNRSGIYRRFSQGQQAVAVMSAGRWLAGLP